MSNLESLLSLNSFVNFQAKKASSPKLLWRNSDRVTEKFLLENSYFIPLEGDPSNCVTQKVRTFRGERYGGEGLGSNGGGVRCGNFATVQIKGIGQNDLVGDSQNYFHSYGGAALSEGILEAIWGEVCDIALPFGAGRVLGLIGTGTDVPVKFPKSRKPTRTPRVLIFRVPTLRPAHFMRAIFFSRSEEGRLGDVNHVKENAKRFQRALVTVLDEKQLATVEGLLQTMYGRLAHQIAAARALRIMHGSLTPSNVGVDGKWIDFGSISAVSDYGRIIIPRGAPDFLNEEQVLERALADLVFYLNKYLRGDDTQIVSAEKIVCEFRKALRHHLALEFAALIGIPKPFLQGVAAKTIDDFQQICGDISAVGNAWPFTILSQDNDYEPSMPSRMGAYHLPTIMCLASCSSGRADLFELLQVELPDAGLRSRFIQSYYSIRDQFVTSAPGGLQRTRSQFVAFNGIRLNTLCPELYRTRLYPEIDRLVEDGRDCAGFIESTVARAKFLFTPTMSGTVDLGFLSRNPAVVDQNEGLLLEQSKPTDSQVMQYALGLGGYHTTWANIHYAKYLSPCIGAA